MKKEMNMAKYGVNTFDLDLKLNQNDFLILNFALWNLPGDYEELRERFKLYSEENEFDSIDAEDRDIFVTTMSHMILGLIPDVYRKFLEAMVGHTTKKGIPALEHILDDITSKYDGKLEVMVEECEKDPGFIRFLNDLGVNPRELGLDPRKAGIDLDDEYDEIDEH